ncbi:MAG: hypothetical protein IKH65_04100 [Clostridia bacterium]|nr:hypothetical protein [Clostridia bacterium]
MKKIIALLMIFILAFSFAACSAGKNNGADKNEPETVLSSDAKVALAGRKMVEKSDSTNTYEFRDDGTYTEMYKGGELRGTWEATETNVTLTLSEAAKYVFVIDRDENGNVSGISQPGGRAFTFAD